MNDIDPGLMVPPPDPPNRVSYAPKDFLDSYYDGDEPEMPNFDAMAHQHGPVDEMALEAPKSKSQTPTSPQSAGQAGQFAAYAPGTPGSRSQPGDPPNQFENAGFQFDIPGETSPASATHSNHTGYSYEQPAGGYRSNGAPPYPPNDQSEADAQNPDALPHHPVPFRPGHDQGAKPVPVRQYNATPASGAAPAAPQQMPLGPTRPAPVTQQELDQLQQRARSNPSDQALQLLLAKKLAEASKVLVADNSRLDPKTKNKTKEKYILEAHKIVKKLASAGYSEGQFYLADCYGEGRLGLPTDPKEAFSLYQSAAKQGHAQSAYRVAVCCEIGQEEGGGTKRDPFKAVQWYKRAASLGDTPAMYKMGMISLKGLLGQSLSPREGVSWLKRAAERADSENPHALHELALMYQNASGNDVVIRDEAYAYQLFQQAADLGYKFSQFRLGAAYENGLMGCPVDNRMSIIWYTRAAAQGEHQSELALSGWYLTGSEGILQQNDTEAYLWARKAATAGLAKAEYAMGYFTEVGIGATANLDDAKRWYWRAAGRFSSRDYGLTLLTCHFSYSTRIPQGSGTSRRSQKGRTKDAEDASFALGRQQAERWRLRCHVNHLLPPLAFACSIVHFFLPFFFRAFCQLACSISNCTYPLNDHRRMDVVSVLLISKAFSVRIRAVRSCWLPFLIAILCFALRSRVCIILQDTTGTDTMGEYPELGLHFCIE